MVASRCWRRFVPRVQKNRLYLDSFLSDGNGGLYSALAAHLPTMRARGVKYFHIYCIDNILCKVADPHMLGFFIERGADVATKVTFQVIPTFSMVSGDLT